MLRPPTLKRPKRLNGREQVVMFGVTFRMTITSEGFEGMSLEVIVNGEEWQRRISRSAKKIH